MIIRSQKQLKKYQEAAKISTEILNELRQAVKIGATPLEVDRLADKLADQHNARPNFKGVGPAGNKYKHATCISVNDTVVHGIPDHRMFEEGDLVKVDFGIEKNNLHTDHCFTVGLGALDAEDERLIEAGKEAVQAAVYKAVAGNYTGDLGFTMQSIVNQAGFSVAKEFVGHGIGATMHDQPQIPAYGKPGRGYELEEGMVLCIEAQVLAGEDDVYFTDDGWTVKTRDGEKAVMFEYMVVVGPEKPVILTPTLNWPIHA